MRTVSFIFLIYANSIYAGTAGNSDLQLVLFFLLLLCALILGVERAVHYIRVRRNRRGVELQQNNDL